MIRWAILLAACLLGACTTLADRGPPSPARIDSFTLVGDGIEPSFISVWVPPGYTNSAQRYGVLYMNDGQNLFRPASAGSDKVWKADQAMLRLNAEGAIEPYIIVGIDPSGPARYRQYVPQKLVDLLPADARAPVDAAAGGPLLSDRYLDLLVKQLKPRIDRSYRTRTDAAHTAIAGSGMGGLASCYALIERPDVFGRAACVSTHWPLIGVEHEGDAAIPHAPEVQAAWRAYLGRNLGRPDGRRVWMDHGSETMDRYYAPYQQAIDASFVDAGWQRGTDFRSETYDGAAHDENAWAARLPDILRFLLAPAP